MTIVAPKPDLGQGAPQVLPDDQSSLLADPWSDGWSLPSVDELEAIGYPGARPLEALQPRQTGDGVTLEEHRQTIEAIRALNGNAVGTRLTGSANGATATTTTEVPTSASDGAADAATIARTALAEVAGVEHRQPAATTRATPTLVPDPHPAEPAPLPDVASAAGSTPRSAIEAEEPFIFIKPRPAVERSREWR